MKTKIPLVLATALTAVALCGCGQAGNSPQSTEPQAASPSVNPAAAGMASNNAAMPANTNTNNAGTPGPR